MRVNRISKVISTAAVVALLAACGGGGSGGDDGPQTVGAEVVRTGGNDAVTYRFRFNPPVFSEVRRIEVVPLSGGGTEQTSLTYYQAFVDGTPRNFDSFVLGGRSSTSSYILHGLTDTREGEIFLEPGSTVLSRLGNTTLPDSGVVTYTGSYAALYSVPGSTLTAGHMFGRVQLETDFASNTTSGLIDQRANSGGQAATSIEMELGAMADGSFSGTTTGGGFDLAGFTSAPGTYGGLIVGENGEEAIGQVTVYHNGPTDFVETGGFIVGMCNPNC